MNNADVFFGGGDSGGTFPAMPRNVGHCARLGGNNMPAQRLVTVSAGSASGGVVTFTATAHGLLIGSSGTVCVSGANEAVFNGKFTYLVTDANTITFNIASGTPATATGSLSVCVDIFEGAYYTLPVNFKYIYTGAPIKRFDKNGAELWASAITPTEADLNVRYLGSSLFPGGDLAVCVADLGGVNTTLSVIVYRFNKTTGAKTTMASVESSFSSSNFKLFPTKVYPAEHPQITLYGRESHIVYSSDTNDITRTIFEVIDDQSFYLAGCKYDGLSVASSAIKDNVEVFFNATNWVSCNYISSPGSAVPIGFPAQYISKDRTVFVGKICTRLYGPNGGSPYKYFNISRGGVSAIAYIPNDPSLCFLVDRHREVVTPANAWLTLASVTEEPIKTIVMPDYVFLTACPTDKSGSTTNNTLLLGSNFMQRNEFDNWLNAVCDHLGLPE